MANDSRTVNTSCRRPIYVDLDAVVRKYSAFDPDVSRVVEENSVSRVSETDAVLKYAGLSFWKVSIAGIGFDSVLVIGMCYIVSKGL